MLAGLIIVPVVSLLTPKLEEGRLAQIFSGYDETITIQKRYSLKEEDDEAQ